MQVFSFVFGDGDPNDGLEEKRWKMVLFLRKCSFFLKLFIFTTTDFNASFNNSQIGQYISSNGGVVTAEELAPFLDVPPPSEESKAWKFFPKVLISFVYLIRLD